MFHERILEHDIVDIATLEMRTATLEVTERAPVSDSIVDQRSPCLRRSPVRDGLA